MFNFNLDKFIQGFPVISEYLPRLKESLSEKKYIHSLGTMWLSYELAKRFGDESIYEKAVVAGLLHDCAKCKTKEELIKLAEFYNITAEQVGMLNPSLLHGPIGAFMALDEYGVKDVETINAIRFHTTGRGNMSILEKIVFVADYAEPNRKQAGVEDIRKLLERDLDQAILLVIDRTIRKILDKQHFLNMHTVDARNSLIYPEIN